VHPGEKKDNGEKAEFAERAGAARSTLLSDKTKKRNHQKARRGPLTQEERNRSIKGEETTFGLKLSGIFGNFALAANEIYKKKKRGSS